MPETDGPGSIVSWASAYAAEGKSATEALRDFRDAGGSVTTQTWYGVFGQVAGAIADNAGLAQLPHEAVPSDDLTGEWQAGRPGVVYSQATVWLRREGSAEPEPFYYTSLSSGLRTKGAVLDEALDYVDTFQGSGTLENFTVLGAELTSVSRST